MHERVHNLWPIPGDTYHCMVAEQEATQQPGNCVAVEADTYGNISLGQPSEDNRDIKDIPNYRHYPTQLQELISEYSDLFANRLSESMVMNIEPVEIKLKDGTILPRPRSKPRDTPVHWAKQAKDIMDNLESQGLIKRVEEYTSTCVESFFVPKPHNPQEPRLVCDFTPLNDLIPRQLHPMPNPSNIVKNFKPNSKFFASFDLKGAYWQVPISKYSRKYTTFITPTHICGARHKNQKVHFLYG